MKLGDEPANRISLGLVDLERFGGGRDNDGGSLMPVTGARLVHAVGADEKVHWLLVHVDSGDAVCIGGAVEEPLFLGRLYSQTTKSISHHHHPIEPSPDAQLSTHHLNKPRRIRLLPILRQPPQIARLMIVQRDVHC